MEKGMAVGWTKINSYIPTYFGGNASLLKFVIPEGSRVDVEVRPLFTDDRAKKIKDNDHVVYLGLEDLLDRLKAMVLRNNP